MEGCSARIKSVDTSRAEAYPGVKAVVTAKDFPAAEDKITDLGESIVNLKYLVDNILASDKALFHAGPYGMLAALSASPESAGKALLIAHSPGIEGLAAVLTGPGSDRRAMARLRAKFPTAALAVIEFDADDWRSLGKSAGRLTAFVTPRELV